MKARQGPSLRDGLGWVGGTGLLANAQGTVPRAAIGIRVAEPAGLNTCRARPAWNARSSEGFLCGQREYNRCDVSELGSTPQHVSTRWVDPD